jgi:cytochrome P450
MTPFPSCTLGGYEIPGGVRVGAQAHSLHRNAEVYPEPEKWDHTRWMDDKNGYAEEQRKERDKWFWAFSSGGRMCVGSNFAMHGIIPLLKQEPERTLLIRCRDKTRNCVCICEFQVKRG